MTGAPPRAAGSYLRFVESVALWTAASALLGALPTRRFAGEEGLAALAAGCAISAVGSLVAGLPLARGGAAGAAQAAVRALLASVLRPLVTLALGLAVALSGRFAVAPFLAWLAISYVVLLVPDTRYALKASGDAKRS